MATRLRIIHFDVSQGESSLISLMPASGTARHVLIDGGKLGRGKYVLRCLKKLGVAALDAVVCTHPDGDHHEGLVPVVQGLKVTALYAPKNVYDPYKYSTLKLACQGSGVTWKDASWYDKLIDASGCLLKVVHVGTSTMGDDNPASIGCTLTFHQFSYFTAGDLPSEDEEKLGLGHMCAFKCGHHGAETSTSKKFVKALLPSAAFISSGHHNHDHPRQSVLDILCGAKSLQRFYTTNCEPDRTGFVGRSGVDPKGFAASARLNGVLGHIVVYTDDTLAKNHDGTNVTFRVAHPKHSDTGTQWKWYAHVCNNEKHVPESAPPPLTSPLKVGELPEYRLEELSTTIQALRKTTPTYGFQDLKDDSLADDFQCPSSPIAQYMDDPENFLKDTSSKKRKAGDTGTKKKRKVVHADEAKRMSVCVWCMKKATGKPRFLSSCSCDLEWFVCVNCQDMEDDEVPCDEFSVLV